MYNYFLPDKSNNKIKQTIESNSVIIIGANGSGKSKLGAWIEEQEKKNVHRVGAQRSLNFNEYITLKSYEQAKNLLFYGNEKEMEDKSPRWNWGKKTTTLLADFENVLSALIAMNNNQNNDFIEKCKKCDISNENYPKVPKTVIDNFCDIWSKIFPHRKINFRDSKVMAELTRNIEGKEETISYLGNEMSDGERVALYLIAQCLCIPSNKTIIIDEPELHLHRSIMNRLWTEVEKYRKDCLFIYITHDTQFAANHRQTKKIWVKSFDGQFWDWEKVEDSNLPEQLLLDILGNRKTVLFVEGTKDSYDTKIYSEIYKNYYIVPCGSCNNVITQTKAMNSNKQLHELKCYGIIDRDYRSDYEIEAYKKDSIYTLKVAEVENLFLVEELLKIVNKIMGFSTQTNIEEVKKYIIDERFKKEIYRQICESVVSEMKYKLTTMSISNKSEEDAKLTMENAIKQISYDVIKSEQEKKFQEALNSGEYKNVLKVFNCKSLSTSTGHFFGFDNKAYRDFIIRKLNDEQAQDIINAIIPYLPEEIPI